MKSILVVGAGLAGAVYARTLAEAGCHVTVIEKRNHIGGNAYDCVGPDGVRYHAYGPHLFHTNNKSVVKWLSQFTDWVPYEHRVQAVLEDSTLVPLPVNRKTVELVFNQRFNDEIEVRQFLAKLAEPIKNPRSAAEYLYSQIGKRLTDLFFRPYSEKMWGHDLDQMHRNIVKRLPLSFDYEDRYFPGDEFQALPLDGYTAMFDRIFNHPGIEVCLETSFAKDLQKSFDFCFNSMPIDEYFDYRFGHLPYRSIRFHHGKEAGHDIGTASVINFTDRGRFTRMTLWHKLPNHCIKENGRFITYEEPCDYRENNFERYYPVQTADDRYAVIYDKYKKLSDGTGLIEFIGRCGTYQYLNMDQVVNQSLTRVKSWIRDNMING
jgi:UDP-galactopyranose mutase